MSPTPRPRERKGGDVVWQVPFRHNGKQTSETFKDRRDAERFARNIAQLGPGEALEILNAQETSATDHDLTTYALEHIEALSGVEPGTRARYRAYVRNDLGRLAHRPVDSITSRDIARWVNELTAADAAGKTIANKHGFLAAVFERAVAEEIIASSPCASTKLPKTVKQTMVFLTHGEFVRFLGCFEPRWHPLVTTLFATGLRWSEATALEVADVDLDACTITVRQAWKAGAGRRLGPPKSEKSRRTITISPEIATLLHPLTVGRSGKAWLFTNAHGGPVRPQTFHDNAWQPAVRLANGERGPKPQASGRTRAPRRATGAPLDPPLGKSPRVHDARHSAASWLLAAGVPISYVQAHLGHESITTTVDRYGHVMPAARQAISAAMSVALSGAYPEIENGPLALEARPTE